MPDIAAGLAGSVIVITGAAGGLGSATAQQLAAAGVALALTDLDLDGLDRTVARAREAGAEVVAVAGDIVDPRTTRTLVEKARQLGPVRGLCNIAGISPAIPFLEVSDADFDQVMGVNCKAQMFAAQAVLP